MIYSDPSSGQYNSPSKYAGTRSIHEREALLGTTRLVRNLDLDKEVSAIKIPVLLLHGDNDKSVKPAEAYRLRDAFADARLQVVPDCGHCPNCEYPELVNELIVEFYRN